MGHRTDLAGLATLLAGIAALHFGKAVLMPLALAILVAFALAPLVSALERGRLNRVLAVVAVCIGIAGVAGGLGWVVARQAANLADDLPRYRTNLREKVQDLRGPIGSLSGAAEEINELGESIEPDTRRSRAREVEVVEKPSVLGAIGDLLAPLLGSIGTAGLVIVLALFLLLEREELRDRMIWLGGARDLSLTTHALDEAGQRVSRYLAMQSLICGIQGVAVGLGLWAIGVPGAALWGALSAVLRFLPYFGPWIAAALPIALSVAAFPGWTTPLLTLSLFVALELVSNNVLEPWLYGSSIGLSPFGVILSAVFWAWLWGIPGLLLAMPLTVCLVVAGRHVYGLRAFPVLLGDQPALPSDVRLYQRLVALDLDEASRVLRDARAIGSLEEVSDAVVLPALRRLAEDAQREAWPPERAAEVRERFEELLMEMADAADPQEASAAGVRVLMAPALDDNDALAGRWLARVCEARGATATFASSHALVSEVAQQVKTEAPDAICIGALTQRAVTHARLLCKRLDAAEGAEILVGLWAAPPRAPGAPVDARFTTITTAAELVARLNSRRLRLRALAS